MHVSFPSFSECSFQFFSYVRFPQVQQNREFRMSIIFIGSSCTAVFVLVFTKLLNEFESVKINFTYCYLLPPQKWEGKAFK